MLRQLEVNHAGFQSDFADFLKQRDISVSGIDKEVALIIENIREKGDASLYDDYTRRFDSTDHPMRVFDKKQISEAYKNCDSKILCAFERAAERIRFFHQKTRPEDSRFTDDLGIELGVRFTPVDCAGLYIPGGKAAYPSSVLMNAIPAQIAGVPRIILAVPAPENKINPLVLACAHLLGLEEIYAIGGAQAIAAMAFGTETVPKVDLIVGPGNAWVAAAKKYVFGHVGIDLIAGPSEILIVADHTQNPCWIAWDLLAQAEHDETAQSLLICNDAAFAKAVACEIENILTHLPRRNIAAESIRNNSAALIVKDIEQQAPDLINQIAPEHLQLAVARDQAERLLQKIRHAGAIFLGASTPEALGDYLAGPSHVLPTSGGARYSSGLSVSNFMKRSSIIGCTSDLLRILGPDAVMLANAEGLSAHAQSITIRIKSNESD